MKEFLRDYPLYREFKLSTQTDSDEIPFQNPYNFHEEGFDHWCENESSYKTFELTLNKPQQQGYGSVAFDHVFPEHFRNEKLDYCIPITARCVSCKDQEIEFLFHIWTKEKVDEEMVDVFIEKIGVYPEHKSKQDKDVSKYLDRESSNWFYKGSTLLDKGMGIGAFAYFRRIVEKELIGIIEDIKTLPDAQSSEIDSLLEEHVKNPKVSTIYSNIFEFLPHSLKSLGDNPIKLLYNLTSEGLHSLSEDECLGKAQGTQVLLSFVIRKMSEEHSEIKNLRNVIKSIK
jgi:hypothetical protein